MKCWAKNVSPCCETQSNEHYISQGLFAGKMLYVKNAPFLGGANKEISKASLTRNCLCKKHNELLTNYDDEAIHFGRSLMYCADLSLRRRKLKARRFSVHTKVINLDNFNRWYIKTYLGLVDFFKYESEISGDTLAKLVYSDAPIRDYMYLAIAMTDEEFQIEESVSIAPIEKNKKTVGMEISIYGIRLNGIFSEKPENKQKPLKLKFIEQPTRLSSLIKFS